MRGSTWLFIAVLVGAVVFIALTGGTLPPLVASHFGANGAANGFMPRGFYLSLMLCIVIGLPALMTLLTAVAVGRKEAKLNLPHRDYWLAPERRAGTMAFLQRQVLWFGLLLILFLCFAHWEVVLANRRTPPQLPGRVMIGGLLVFFVLVALWLRHFYMHFRTRTWEA